MGQNIAAVISFAFPGDFGRRAPLIPQRQQIENSAFRQAGFSCMSIGHRSRYRENPLYGSEFPALQTAPSLCPVSQYLRKGFRNRSITSQSPSRCGRKRKLANAVVKTQTPHSLIHSANISEARSRSPTGVGSATRQSPSPITAPAETNAKGRCERSPEGYPERSGIRCQQHGVSEDHSGCPALRDSENTSCQSACTNLPLPGSQPYKYTFCRPGLK